MLVGQIHLISLKQNSRSVSSDHLLSSTIKTNFPSFFLLDTRFHVFDLIDLLKKIFFLIFVVAFTVNNFFYLLNFFKINTWSDISLCCRFRNKNQFGDNNFCLLGSLLWFPGSREEIFIAPWVVRLQLSSKVYLNM